MARSRSLAGMGARMLSSRCTPGRGGGRARSPTWDTTAADVIRSLRDDLDAAGVEL
jgi:hypothetical protein